MPDPESFVPTVPEPAATLVERLTTSFYAWERRGRGWQVWPYPVQLEPPFRPFYSLRPLTSLPVDDDARKPTILSSLADRVRAFFAGPAPPSRAVGVLADEEFWEPEPEELPGRGPLLELQVSLPPEVKVTREAAEQLLLSLSSITSPLSFELVGLPERTLVQFACHPENGPILRQQLVAYFPEGALTEEANFLVGCWEGTGVGEGVVVDFGLSHEFMLPMRTFRAFEPDPLIGLTGALADLHEGEIAVLQVLFQPTRHPWSESMLRAVTDREGGAFFSDAPDVLPLAKAKVASPLYAALVRIGALSPASDRAWAIARALGGGLRQFARPTSNELIPLSDADYDPYDHEHDLLARQSRRCGMLLNLEELVSLVHLPSASVRAEKLARERRKTRAAPATALGQSLVLGENLHAGEAAAVTLSSEQRLRHIHLVGATGTGKSHLLLNLILQDIEAGEGVGVLDPHGDLVDRVLGSIPLERLDEVVVLDPGDEAWPVGLNLLQAHSALEKTLLASDLVAVFRRLATSWGDQMTAVLRNAVLAFLESEEGGTLADLQRFLVEEPFRRAFLPSIRDPEVVYFWEREFPLLSGRPQGPVLTRLDAFLAPKPLRHMVSQRENRVDFAEIMSQGRIFLAKLAQGAIGQENAHLLGSLLVAKFQQLTLARQAVAEAERRPFWLYVDEFQHFVTPSMAQILAGARKYGLGLTLAHQELGQLQNRSPELTSSLLTNPAVRVCFRVGDRDARRLAEAFASFGSADLQTLGVGEALCRVERADWDFNLRTLPHAPADPNVARARREQALARSRERYATPLEEVERSLRRKATRVPEAAPRPLKGPQEVEGVRSRAQTHPGEKAPRKAPGKQPTRERKSLGEHTPPVEPPPALGRGGAQHQYLQELIKRWAGNRGWHVIIEKPVLDGLGRVDVALERGQDTVACEVSIASSPGQEVSNVQKCLAGGFEAVAVVSPERKVLAKAREAVSTALEEENLTKVHFLTPEELFAFLEEREAHSASREETVRGWRVKTRYQPMEEGEKSTRTQAIASVILKAGKRLKGK